VYVHTTSVVSPACFLERWRGVDEPPRRRITHPFSFPKNSQKGGALARGARYRLGKSARDSQISIRLLHRLRRYQRVPRTVGESSITDLLRDDDLSSRNRGTVTRVTRRPSRERSAFPRRTRIPSAISRRLRRDRSRSAEATASGSTFFHATEQRFLLRRNSSKC